ncbi:MAG: metallophosphoesterase [bacterium]|nr:metallophosphoesterase [bacterium]
MILFVLVVLLATGLFHWFLYARLVTALNIASPALLWPLRSLAVFLALSYFIARLSERHAPEAVVHALHWIASIWMGLMWELLWITLLLYLVKVALLLGGVWARLDSATTMLIGRYAVVSTLGAAVLLCGWGMKTAFGPARVAHVQVPVPNLTPELRGLRIVMASDFHASVLVAGREVERWSEQIMRLKPDLILLPGDIVDRSADDILYFADAFHRLRAPLGVYGSTGNHEYYVGLEGALEFCRAAGIRMLMNETVELPNGLVLAGIEDRTARQFRLSRPTPAEVLRDVPREKPVIFLNHTPDTREAREAVEAGADLVLSGHTHGGQIWPFSYFSRMVHPYHWGLYSLGRGFIFTSCGVGDWGTRMRIGAPPEIALIRLVDENEPPRVRWEAEKR